MKRCCRIIKKFNGENHIYKKCPDCGHLYIDEYPKFTVQCYCGNYPNLKALNRL